MTINITLINTNGCLKECSRSNVMQIENLTKQQVQLLDKIWSIEKESELSAWMDTLPPHLQDEVVVLVEISILDVIDTLVDNMNIYTDAFSMIMKCK